MNDAVDGDGVGQRLQLRLVKVLSGLIGIGLNFLQGQLQIGLLGLIGGRRHIAKQSAQTFAQALTAFLLGHQRLSFFKNSCAKAL